MNVELLKVPFSIGYELGALSRHLEIVIRTDKSTHARERQQIEAFRVYESLKFIVDELKMLNVAENVRHEIKAYLEELGGKTSEIKENEMLLGKIKRKIRERKERLDRDLKSQEAIELEQKIKIWKERITNEMARYPIE